MNILVSIVPRRYPHITHKVACSVASIPLYCQRIVLFPEGNLGNVAKHSYFDGLAAPRVSGLCHFHAAQRRFEPAQKFLIVVRRDLPEPRPKWVIQIVHDEIDHVCKQRDAHRKNIV